MLTHWGEQHAKYNKKNYRKKLQKLKTKENIAQLIA